MEKLFRNKKFLIIAVSVVFLAIVFTIVIYQYNSREEYPIAFDFDETSGIITFQLLPEYELQNYWTEESDGKLSDYDTTKKTISFDVKQIKMNWHEYITFHCERTDNNTKPVPDYKYEIIRGSDETIITIYRPDNSIRAFNYPPV
jgi:hypothetical protein